MNNRRQGFHWARKNLSTMILVLLVTSQLLLVFRNYIPDTFFGIWRVRDYSAKWRSASIIFGDNYAEYIEFVKAIVPEDSLVIIPKEDQIWNFGHVGLMQYFLFPRGIADCPIDTLDECILGLKGPDTYILAPNSNFPPRDLADQVKKFIPFDKENGVYVPLP